MDENIIINDDTEELLISDAAQIIDEIEIKDVTSVEEGTIDTIRILPQDNINITLNEAFSPLGEPVENSHESLNGRYSPNQHSIEAIEGLEERLQDIESVKQVRSTGENVAHYYMWNDGNSTNDLRCGYFVSFVQGTNKITISDTNIIGVTISKENVGFIGNDINGTINPIVTSNGVSTQTYPYGLVCTSGRVKVRALSGVSASDKVIPYNGGFAKKSDNGYGYKVIATETVGENNYVIISLTPQIMDTYELSDDISDMEDRLDVDEANISVAINTANTALQNAGTTASQVSGQITTIQGQVQSAINTANAASVAATNAGTSADLAQETATLAQTTAASIQRQVTTYISDMEDDIQDLIDSVEPIVTWDGTNGTTGASYLIDHIQNNLATKTEVSTVDTKADNAFTAIQTNAKTMQTMAMIERKYSVGPHSPVYGMSYEYATEMIPVGMVYVPTVNVTDTTEDGNHSFTFYSGSSYEWDGTGWILHSDDSVIGYNSSSTFPIGTNQTKYWYVGASDVTHDDIIYPAGSLCLWSNGMWVVVANIKDYGNFHITSRLYQTADELGAEIANAQGDIVTINARITNDESQITALATQQSTQSNTIALIQANASETNARIDSIVTYDGNALMQKLVLDSSPSGNQFYTAEPTWDDDKWSFANTYTSSPVNPCWAKVSGDNTKYYKYTCSVNNIWTRETYKYITSLAGINQKVSANESSISSIVSNIGADGAVTAASIIQKVNSDSSEISMSADRIKLTGGTINMATGKFKITANNGFELNENGISWNSASNPTKMVYSQELVLQPSNNTLYSSFPPSSTTTWHTSITSDDKYASETTDGGATWSAVRQIVGIDGYTPQKGVDYFDGTNGSDGYTPVKGVDYFDGTNGTNGTDGVSIVFKGSYASAPNNPQNGWAYYNTTAKSSYVYQGGSWYQMSIDGVNGQNGTNGISIVWKGESSSSPSNPITNWVYKDTDDGKVYIYNGTGWELMVLDGSDGQDGANGIDGNSVYITYNNNAADSTPSTPTGNGTTNGWHTDATSSSVWMSQKVASSASSGTWGTPIRIKGTDGQNGSPGAKGDTGATGDSVKVVRAYYLQNSATAPSKPTSSTLPSGWTSTPSGVTTSNQYEFVSECTVTNGSYGTWSNPVCYAHYGSDATVNDVNVFNALTSNGTKFGLFNSSEDKLYINASYINTGTISAERIAANSITAAKIDTTGLTAEKIQIKNGDNVLFDAGYTSSSAVSIGGFTVGSSSIYNGKTKYSDSNNGVYIGTDGIGLGKGKFYVTSDGNVTLAGNINMTGNITWGASSSPTKVLYARTSLSTPATGWSDKPDSGANVWHKNFDSSNDKYISYSYDGGSSWTVAIKTVGTNGSDASVTRNNIVSAMLNATANDGIYSYKLDGTNVIGIRATAIKAGAINAYDVYLEDTQNNVTCGIDCDSGYDGVSTTYGARLYAHPSNNSSISHYVITTNSGTRMQSGDYSIYATDNHTAVAYNNSNLIAISQNGIFLTSAIYGTSRPSTGTAGQIFFEIEV